MHRPLIFRTREAAYGGLSETMKRLKLKRNKVMYLVKPPLTFDFYTTATKAFLPCESEIRTKILMTDLYLLVASWRKHYL